MPPTAATVLPTMAAAAALEVEEVAGLVLLAALSVEVAVGWVVMPVDPEVVELVRPVELTGEVLLVEESVLVTEPL